jgi:tetratricopeptide (TPR) repeat protein
VGNKGWVPFAPWRHLGISKAALSLTKFSLTLLLFASLSFAQTSLETIREAIEDGLYPTVVQFLAPQFIQTEPDNPQGHFLFAEALYYTGDIGQARLEFDKAQLLNLPLSPEVKHLNGLLQAAEGKMTASLENLRAAFEESQDYDIAMDWGRIAWEHGNMDEALEAFEKAAQTPLGQTQIWPRLNQGRILHLVLKDYKAAIKAYNQAIDIVFDTSNEVNPPGYVEAFFRLGQVYEALGDIDQAISQYQAASLSDPNYLPALTALERLQR